MSSLADRLRRVSWLAVPLAAYLVITLALPAANGALAQPAFGRHALVVIAACVAVVGIILVLNALIDVTRSHLWRKR